MPQNNKTFKSSYYHKPSGGTPHYAGRQGGKSKGQWNKNLQQGNNTKSSRCCGNLGLIFTRRYFDGLTVDLVKEIKETESKEEKSALDKAQTAYYEQRNKNIIQQARSLEEPFQMNQEYRDDDRIAQFKLQTSYPGLLIGTGIPHRTGHKGETKLGLMFDHTTGLPVIPGSSIKGVLRSVFPGKKYNSERANYIWEKLIEKPDIPDNGKETFIRGLEIDIFGSYQGDKNKNICGNDIFFDAFPLQVGTHGLLGLDYITPHTGGEFSNPTPIQFMRIEPGVVFHFEFLLHDFTQKDKEGNPIVVLVSKETKKELFKSILMDIGIGAKTNVGYGQLKALDGQ